MIEYLAPADWQRQVHVDTNGAYSGVTGFFEAIRAAADQLIPITCRGEVPKRAIVIISVVRNEMRRLSSFLAHYRRLGADRFLIVDNASNDGTDRFLSEQPDVDLWLATGSYLAAHQGRMWTDGLAHAIARGRWVMIVDADEFLVYDGMDRHSLQDLVGLLDRRGERRLSTPMIDVYGRGPIRNTPLPQNDPLAGDWWFDTTSYKTLQSPYGDLLMGGPRGRVFSEAERPFTNCVQKFPISRFDAATCYCWVHRPYPYHWNQSKPLAALVHVKFTEDFPALVERACSEKQHSSGSVEYFHYQRALKENPNVSFFGPDSRRFDGPQALLSAGFIEPIDWLAKSVARRPDIVTIRHRLHARARSWFGVDFSRIKERWLRVERRH
jgi:hypothetical protein